MSSTTIEQFPTLLPPPPIKKRSRRNSDATMEQLPPDWLMNRAWLRSLHEFIYPSQSKFYWYRRAKIGHSLLTLKYLKLMSAMFVMGLAGSGYLFPVLFLSYAAGLRQIHDFAVENTNHTLFGGLDANELALATENPPWIELASTWWFVLGQMAASGAVTCLVYVMAGMHLIEKYYVGQKDRPEEWKCQPNGFLTEERWREEKMLGSFNSFMAGFYGTGLYFLHLNYPFLKLYYESGSRGMLHFFTSAVVIYIWIDFYSYWAHRFLHTPFMYRNVHKVHHRYVHPTPFSAFALHPIEFWVFQSAGIFILAFVETHIVGYLATVLFIAYHNQIDHSGIDFEGDLPWMPTTAYHDQHHEFFHLNFGLHLVTWDWLGGTLRMKSRQYGEDRFVGQQDDVKKES